ncbi:hypothetical protein BDV40DRAFT_267826 [Aspergillus tamarii]|uniref:Uncharacterized protein n=1 Tax=Aspergillus tamarii TaxID=41984 RepID=A0A5N6UTN6_ASPTM|nr:hypothetical protein BDV40DRAFT_267826 [Aspergillus tamarii]
MDDLFSVSTRLIISFIFFRLEVRRRFGHRTMSLQGFLDRGIFVKWDGVQRCGPMGEIDPGRRRKGRVKPHCDYGVLRQ